MRRPSPRLLLSLAGFVVALYLCLCFVPFNDLTLLMRASRSGNVRLTRALLLMGAQSDQRSSERGASALFFAAANGHADVARVLLAGGADPNALNSRGATPLCVAGELSRVRPDIFRALIDGGADPNAGRWNALQCLFGQQNILEKASVLLDAGAAVDGKPDAGDPPVVNAASAGSDELVRLLLTRGAKVDARGHGGRTALMEAAARGCLACVRVLISAGADSTAVDGSGATALQIAAGQSRKMATVQYQAIVDLLRGPANGSRP